LVVDDQRVRLPAVSAKGLMVGRHTTFKIGGAVDLTSDQNGAVEKKRRCPLFDDVETCVANGSAAEHR